MTAEAAIVEVAPYLDEEDERVNEKWAPATLEEADWCLKRLGELNAEAEENKRVCEFNIAREKLRCEKLNSKVERGVAFFTACLKTYAEANRPALLGSGRKKSRELSHGTLAWRKSGGSLVVKDEAVLLEWLRTQPFELGLLRVKEEPALAELKKHFKSTGELPPGMDLSPEDEEFDAKPLEVADGRKH